MRRTGCRSVAVATAIVAASVAFVAAPARAADEVYSFPASGSLQVQGKGFGHGHGMSQYGAKGRGEAGQSWTTITNFYYPGTTVATIASTPIKVALTNAGAEGVAPPTTLGRYECDSTYPAGDKRNCGVALVPQSGLQYGWLGGSYVTLPATLGGKPVTLWGVRHVENGDKLRVFGKTADGRISYGSARADGFKFDRSGDTSVRFLDGTVSAYKGSIEVRKTSTTRLIRLNIVPMESYLRGVVPREMPATWDADAVRAQAVAARTYAAQERGASTTRPYDSCDSTWCQVYRGEKTTYPSGTVIEAHAASNAAITATAGKVRNYNGKPAFAQFSASNGGQMSAGGQPYLTFGADPYDKYPSWTSTLTRSQVQSAFPAIGVAQRIVITGRDGHGTWGGRVTTARLEGSAGSTTISGDRLRTLGGFKSSYLTFVRPDPHDRIGTAASGAGAADVASRLTTGALVHRTWTEAGRLGSTVALGGGTSYAPGIARSAAGRLDVVVTGTNKRLYLKGRPAGSSSWSGWTNLGGSVNGRPAVVALANGYLDVFVRGTDGKIWERYRRPSGTWSGWIAVGGSVAAGSGPAAVETSDGTKYVVVQGTDGQGWFRSNTAAGWSARWTALGGAIAGDPAATSDAPGRVSVVVRGTNNRGYVKDLTNGVPAAAWTGIGGTLRASPAVFAVPGSDRLDVLANASGGTLMHASRTAGTWSAWAIAE